MKKNFLIGLILLSLIISSCGAPSAEEAGAISTAAAQTVEARFTAQANVTATPQAPGSTATATPTATLSPTETAIPNSAADGCLIADFVSETIPDGTVIAPGEYFMKSWTVQNNGTCTWYKGYKLVYWDGDILGGAAEYQFFEDILPGETMTFPIQLLAPTETGVYEGFWKFKSPSGYLFGVGAQNVPISVNINVGNASEIGYGITSVVYSLTRDPEVGCPTNVHWTVNATITVSGRMTVVAQFIQSDGNHGPKETLVFDEASSQTMSVTWTLYKGAGPAPRSVQLVVFQPEKIYYPPYTFVNNCPDQED